jgi:hypothetical protein
MPACRRATRAARRFPSCRRVPVMVFLLVGDRMPRRTIMLVSDFGRFLTQALAAGLLLSGRARLWELLVLFTLHGLA